MRIPGRGFLPLLLLIALPVTCIADYVAQPHFAPPPAEPAPLPNNFWIKNDAGASASFSTEGFVDRNDFFHAPQGSNGRSCATCHSSEAGWSITPAQIQRRFIATGGTDPLFNKQDANNPDLDLSTVAKRKRGYSMLLQGLFRRGGLVITGDKAEFEVIAVDDPNGVGSKETFSFYRRPLTTANMQLISGVLWDDRLTTAGDGRPPRLGLARQARGNISGAQEGPKDPDPARVNAIVEEELLIWHAQIAVPGVNRLDTCGGRGGPQFLKDQAPEAGRWNLFDGWLPLVNREHLTYAPDGRGQDSCHTRFGDERRAQIVRGQELFNTRLNADNRTCQGCHNVVNNGTRLDGRLFNIGTAAKERRTPGMPLYTLRKKNAADVLEVTDPGQAFVTGQWAHVGAFKVPTLRGLAARPPYFHNGIAPTLRDVVRHYEQALGFKFTNEERDDLVAFLNAL